MVVPVPVVLQEDNVETLTDDVFDRVDRLASPRLVEYWEQDPCMYEQEAVADMAAPMEAAAAAREGSGAGRGAQVVIEAQFQVGEYEIVILSANDSSALDTWLRDNGYNIPDGAEPILRPYVEEGMKFFVAKVDIEEVAFEDGQAMLSPLRFHYDSEDFRLPVRLGLLNSSGKQDLIVHILAENQRYEVANYENVTIPTNIDVADDVRERFGEFYAALFDRTLERNPGSVVTEYAWQATGCDPCPGPVLSVSDLTTLGADVLPGLDAGARTATLSASQPTTAGPLPAVNVYRMINMFTSQLQGCYEQEASTSSGEPFTGRAMVAFTVAPDGTVSGTPRVEQPGVGGGLQQCLAREIGSIRFPSTGATETEVRLPLNMSMQAQASWQVQNRLNGFVLTRLHARYAKETLGEDLVFRPADPITGGREVRGPDGELEHGSQSAGTNNFQARYAIRHRWEGPIECDDPRRGIWGGPPSGVDRGSEPQAAQDLAFAPRGRVSLPELVKQDIPELEVTAAAAAQPPVSTGGGGGGGTGASGGGGGSGCDCDVTGGGPLGGTALLALFGALWLRRRRRH